MIFFYSADFLVLIHGQKYLDLVSFFTLWVSSNNHSSFLYVRLGKVKVNDCPAAFDNRPLRVRAHRAQGLEIGEKLL